MSLWNGVNLHGSGIFFANFFFTLSTTDENILCGFVVQVMLCLRTFESITAWILVIMLD